MCIHWFPWITRVCVIGYNHTIDQTPWWRHQMETFSALLAICAGNSPVPGEFPTQRPVTRSYDDFFDPRLYKRLSKQSWGWWFETLSRPLLRHCNAMRIMNSLEIWHKNDSTATGRSEDTFSIFEIKAWLSDFIMSMTRLWNLIAWPVWGEGPVIVAIKGKKNIKR